MQRDILGSVNCDRCRKKPLSGSMSVVLSRLREGYSESKTWEKHLGCNSDIITELWCLFHLNVV